MDFNTLDLLHTKCKDTLQKLLRPHYLALIPKWIAEASPSSLRGVSFLGTILAADNFHVFETTTPSALHDCCGPVCKDAAGGGSPQAGLKNGNLMKQTSPRNGKSHKPSERPKNQ
ncbi:hypothetical protein, conserved [Eimeria maxima]|uniref:Uncharacterized protein n=1 Tax=Eimeria maxima TaxID=5804 RepID=U6M167_EIMMA|nr:hypothetical protein, conserved [Eimeria maxima]CDJ56833.1 hypothetical protein, conserved [Eimeria maxima]